MFTTVNLLNKLYFVSLTILYSWILLFLPNMEAVELGSPSSSNQFDITKCLFCQGGNDLVSSDHGRTKIKEASEIRKDAISKRLERIGNQTYVYHLSNNCYKRYTNKTLLDRISRKRKQEEESVNVTAAAPSPKTSTTPPRKSSRGEGGLLQTQMRNRHIFITNRNV